MKVARLYSLLLPSLPVWERGLKHAASDSLEELRLVAPRVGAWIETVDHLLYLCLGKSLPVWERGLKHKEGFLLDIYMCIVIL